MKIYTFILTSMLLLLTNLSVHSQIYVGAGAGYTMPFSKFEETNKSAVSYIANIENRYYCKIWYGLRVEYSSFEPSDNLDVLTPYYNDMLNITPHIRYNFLGQNCYNDEVFPYLQAGLMLSSFGKTDNTSRFGIGANAGGGFTYGFNILKTCMMLDANVAYNMPNIILRDEKRDEIQFVHLNLTLNVKL